MSLTVLLLAAAAQPTRAQDTGVYGADCKVCKAVGDGEPLFERVNDPDANRMAFSSALAAVNNCLDITLLGDRNFPVSSDVLSDIKQHVQDETWIYSDSTGAVSDCKGKPCQTDRQKAEGMYRLIFGELADRAPSVILPERIKLSCEATFGDRAAAVKKLHSIAGNAQ
jgi:hypothetical protein